MCLPNMTKYQHNLDGIWPVSPSTAFWCKRGQCLRRTWHGVIQHIRPTPCQLLFHNKICITDLWLNKNKQLFLLKKFKDAKFCFSFSSWSSFGWNNDIYQMIARAGWDMLQYFGKPRQFDLSTAAMQSRYSGDFFMLTPVLHCHYLFKTL